MIYSMLKRGCRVGFFGLGKSNIALLSYLPLENCSVVIRSDCKIDRGAIPSKISVERVLEGEDAVKDISEDIIFFSPSVKRERGEFVKARERGVIFSSDAELFFERNRLPIFAVSGSDGKSTTATLIHLLLSSEGIKSQLIGNIGEPMISHLDSDAECFVCELSSFMLTYACPKPQRGCITNITPNHLDWHRSFEEYKETKISLLKSSEKAVVFEENLGDFEPYGIISDRTDFCLLKERHRAKVYITSEGGFICKNGEKLLSISETSRKESHNIKNLMMAIAMTDGYVTAEKIKSIATSFNGLPHRCEKVLCKNGVEYIDSSIDSTPERTVQTLDALGRQVVILLGGRSKGLDYGRLSPALKKYAKYAILIGENATEIFDKIGSSLPCEVFEDFELGVKRGSELARDVGVLLLSPASTSYDAFKNFAEKGEKFKEIILKYQ